MPVYFRSYNRQRALLLAALFTLIASVYMLTFSARIESGDTLYLFDAVGSWADFGDFKLDISAGTRLPQAYDNQVVSYPLPTVDSEPLPILLAAPLYVLARLIPGWGLVHTVYLFNILVCTLSCLVLFRLALALGYNDRTATAAALGLAFCTAVWPYSKSFFREPLAMLMILTTVWALERSRAYGYRHWGWLLFLLVSGAAMLLTKASAVFILPALLWLALPMFQTGSYRRVLIGAGVGLLIVMGGFFLLNVFGEALGLGERYNPFRRRIEEGLQYLPQALLSYWISPGGSLWGTSPIGLLILPGLWHWYRMGHRRYVIGVPLGIIGFSVGYAMFSGSSWFGGLSWPPRFLIPIVPWLLIGALPFIDQLLRRRPAYWIQFAVLVLIVYSLWVQFSGVALWWGAYTEGLPGEAQGLLEWNGGLYDPRFLRWVIIPQLWSRVPLDFVWLRTQVPLWAVGFGLLAFVSALLLTRRPLRPFAALLPVIWLIGVGLGLSAISKDPLYWAERPGLPDLIPLLNRTAAPGDIVVLSNREYENFFLNHAKLNQIRVVGLPPQPGDQPSETQLPDVVSPNPDVLLTNYTLPFLHRLADSRSRLWLLENRGSDFPWAVRPVERFMAAHYYLLNQVQTEPPDPTIRLLAYDTTDAPDPSAYQGPEFFADALFGDRLRLLGLNLPHGLVLQPGDTLPVSFLWTLRQPTQDDYRIAWFVRTEDGAPVAQGMDSRPNGDFSRTTEWTLNAPYWDHRALQLPPGMPPGSYRLWVKVYRFDETFTPRDLIPRQEDPEVRHMTVIDGTIAQMWFTLEVPVSQTEE